MKLFLCSYFAEVGMLLKENVKGKRVLFIPTASIHEDYTGYVDEAREIWKKMNVNLTETDISKASASELRQAFETVDILYFTGGNSFFLIDELKKTGADALVRQHIENGKLYVGESGGAIICAPELSYIQAMDEVPKEYSQKDYRGLGLVDFYVVPHYGCPPFEESSDEIVKRYSYLRLRAITNSQAILVEDEKVRELSV